MIPCKFTNIFLNVIYLSRKDITEGLFSFRHEAKEAGWRKI